MFKWCAGTWDPQWFPHPGLHLKAFATINNRLSVFERFNFIYMYVCVTCTQIPTEVRRQQLDSLELQFQATVSLGAGNQTSALWKSRKCFQPYHHQSHLCCRSGPPAHLVFPKPSTWKAYYHSKIHTHFLAKPVKSPHHRDTEMAAWFLSLLCGSDKKHSAHFSIL